MDAYPKQQYEMLQAPEGGLRLPPHRRPPPSFGKPPRGALVDGGRRWGCCCFRRCLCWCCVLLLLFLVSAGAAGAYLYRSYRSQLPRYSIKSLAVDAFDIEDGGRTLHTRLVAAVSARNPNDRIGIAYGEGSRVRVTYRGAKLCAGKLPSFYQGHRNRTVMRVAMEGRRPLSFGLVEALEQSRRRGRIPLDVHLSVPVALEVGGVQVRQVFVDVRCSLVVDGLTPDKKVGIKSAAYKVNVVF